MKKNAISLWFVNIRQNLRFKPFLFAIIAFVLVSACFFGIIIWYAEIIQENNHRDTELDASRTGILLEKTLTRRLDMIESLDAFVHANPDKNELVRSFQIYASALNTSVAGIEVISLAPDNIQNYVFPEQANKDILGHDVYNQSKPEMQEEILKTMKTGQTVIIPPHRRYNDDLILVARKATNIDGKYWGLVTVMVNLQPVFEEAGLQSPDKPYQIAIRDQQGRVFFGDRKVFNSDPAIYQIDHPDSFWEVGVIQNFDGGDNQAFQLFLISALLGIILILITVMVYGIASRHENLTRIVSQRTVELQRANNSLSEEIIHRKKYEAALLQTNKKIQIFGQLARTDIANQVFIIGGFLDLLRERITDSPMIGYINHIDQALGFIGTRLEFSSQFQDLGKDEPVWHNLGQSLSFALSHLDTSTITREVDPGDIEIYADALLEKAFFNIFENSLIHGGKVTRIKVQYEIKDIELVLRIEDDGVGIPSDLKEQIFIKGMGSSSRIGLFFTREILSITGISITETGEAGIGAVFEIRVPEDGWRKILRKS